MQKLYKKLGVSGGANIALGVVMLVVGLVCGILTIINGAVMLQSKNRLTF